MDERPAGPGARPDRPARAQGIETGTVGDLPPDDGSAQPGTSAAPPAGLGRGAFLGRYLVLDLVGRGGMGEVYVAYDPELNRKVALKVLRHDRPARPGDPLRARLLREARAAARLVHPNLVTLYDVGAVGERVFLTMELVDGVDLSAWRRAGPRSWRDVLRVFRDAGRGLAAAHRAGLVHRDFKPGNVMVARDGRVVVLDFGLARDAGPQPPPAAGPGAEDGSGPPAETGGRGTPAYMAPEQFRDAAVGPPADQFSFCAALYEALYGEPPYPGDTREGRRQSVERGAVREAPAGARVPGWVRRAVLRGLSPDPAARFATMDDLLAALARDPALRRRRWATAAALAGVAVAGVAAWGRVERRQALLCTGAERKLAGLWDDARRGEVRAGLARAGGSHARQTWGHVEPLLDGYARQWVAAHTEACEATHRRGEQSAQMLDLRMACLEGRRREIRAVTDLMARADAPVARNAVALAAGLSGLAACADPRALLAVAPPPDDPATLARLDEVRSWLAEGKALETSGKYGEAFALSERAVHAADALGYRPLAAEARLALAPTHARLGRAEAMRETLLDAAAVAQASGHDAALARAFNYLILVSHLTGDPGAAHVWARLAGSTLERLGGHDEIAAEREGFLGMVANQEQRPLVAVEHFRRHLALMARAGSKRPLHPVYQNIGVSLIKAGRYREAEAQFERGLRELERTFGRDHPDVAGALFNLGRLHQEQGHTAAAIGYFRRSLDLYERWRWPGREPAFPLTGLGQTLIDAGRAAEALPPLERAVRLREGGAEDPAGLALSRFHLARALWLAAGGDRSRARRLARAARDGFGALGERAGADVAQVEAWLAAHPGAP